MDPLTAILAGAFLALAVLTWRRRRFHVLVTFVGLAVWLNGILLAMDDSFDYNSAAVPLIVAGCIGLIAGAIWRWLELG